MYNQLRLSSNVPSVYQNNKPFPFIKLQNVFPKETLRGVLAEWPDDESFDWQYKECATSKKRHISHVPHMGPITQAVIRELNSPKWLELMTTITGIPGLKADPYLEGAGLHHIPKGGFLKIHSDFNWHAQLGLRRRINLLLYLNDWVEGDGGEVELWDRSMTECVAKVPPLFNDMVIFNTDTTSYHGHPDPCNKERKSIAIYYYTSGSVAHQHNTLYQKRPGGLD